MHEATPFPWQKAMQFAFGHLRISPNEFWSMTMRELNCAMAAHLGEARSPMLRSEFDQLTQTYPDGNSKNGN